MADKARTNIDGFQTLLKQVGTGANGEPIYALAVQSVDSAGAMSTVGVYRRAAAVSATPGDAVLVSGVTTAGTVVLTLGGGGSATVSVPLGSTVLPFGATAAALGTAVGGTFQSLFFT